MKHSMYVSILIIFAGASCLAIDRSAKAQKSPSYKGSLEQYNPMEIELKDNDNVSVAISQGRFEVNAELEPNNRVMRFNHKEINIESPIDIELFGQGTKKRYNVMYRINPEGKTVYLKIEKSRLAPREGSFIGSKTPSGLSVKNNISAQQIRLFTPDVKKNSILATNPSKPADDEYDSDFVPLGRPSITSSY